jgi:phenylacetate-coenzyme A ligase PaaK-like adenylate-forming protein
LERVFGAPVLNVYSCTEHLIMGLSRPGDGGMYLLEDDLIFELEADHTCVTNLFNRTLPLIRYRMEDVLLPLESAPESWPFRKVREIVGRNEHVPFFRNARGSEDFISPHVINEFFVPGLRRFQMRVLDADSFLFCVCLESGMGLERRTATLAAIEHRWREILAQKQLENVGFRVQEEEELPVDPKTGKFRLVVRAPSARTPR